MPILPFPGPSVLRRIAVFFLLMAICGLLAASPAPAGAPYHGNTNSHKFHSALCRYYNCPHCTRIFQTRDEAIAAGYVPCRVCNP
ncbi:MAG: Ada metal-binding domain-containing protein [Desulfovibrio sp.]|nr:MAG: Ada metal-binding domain-containing protein [Desulfovibrio sp.]